MKYFFLFILIQIIALILAIIGIPICAVLSFGGYSRQTTGVVLGKLNWPRWAWLWDNDEDGTAPLAFTNQHPSWSLNRCEFVWTALRNPVNNFRFVPGVSKVGRPLWRKTWGTKPGGWYIQAGWNNSGYPVLSGGRNVNPF